MNDTFTQEQEEANLAFCDAIDELARVYDVDKEGLRYTLTIAAEEAINDSLGGNDE